MSSSFNNNGGLSGICRPRLGSTLWQEPIENQLTNSGIPSFVTTLPSARPLYFELFVRSAVLHYFLHIKRNEVQFSIEVSAKREAIATTTDQDCFSIVQPRNAVVVKHDQRRRADRYFCSSPCHITQVDDKKRRLIMKTGIDTSKDDQLVVMATRCVRIPCR